MAFRIKPLTEEDLIVRRLVRVRKQPGIIRWSEKRCGPGLGSTVVIGLRAARLRRKTSYESSFQSSLENEGRVLDSSFCGNDGGHIFTLPAGARRHTRLLLVQLNPQVFRFPYG